MKRIISVIVFSAALLFAGCSTMYYGALEQVGIHKRELLVDRVEAAQESQEEAKEQFEDALEAFRATVKVDGGELEKRYDQLKGQYEDCESRAEAVRDRIAAVEDVAESLFREWEAELNEYSREDLRRASQTQLRETRREYNRLIAAMQRAEQKMEPVLTAFGDQVLFLKHNLNARAIASLKNEVTTVERDVAALIDEMNTAIEEAETFIAQMKN
ncbi:DUF2959 domain-containing protein [Cerasicoccus arenae]|uniref:DUF2959 domain-containing protein n=1 Tax=Cerasicoccus arenae TaxID=424488 RepID=A0A8J3DE88_9BACT|nr:DUF2959 domain-containing protein [Cerasicoccus arenae]MBK1857016.1 DUF2959 domain-containing protein [Cerasicoccus arenae]GHB90397.1 DUF2959 domain-containing protein [Cerasicoccus arenae]